MSVSLGDHTPPQAGSLDHLGKELGTPMLNVRSVVVGLHINVFTKWERHGPTTTVRICQEGKGAGWIKGRGSFNSEGGS